MNDIPITYNQGVMRKFKEKWKEAIKEELNNLYDNNIMTIVKRLPENKKPIKTKWIFTIKANSNG